MPTIFVKGKQVPVSDDFFNLPPEEQEATVRRIAGQIAFGAITGTRRMNFNQPSMPNNKLPKPEASWSEVPQNIRPSAINAATGLWDMITHPQRTAETLIDTAQGGVDRIVPEGFTNFMDTYISPRSRETRERQRQVSGAVGEALYDRYGTWRNIRNTMITDPVGSALDVVGLATGAAGLIRGGLAVGSKANLARTPGAALSAERLAVNKVDPIIPDNNMVRTVAGGPGTTVKSADNAGPPSDIAIPDPLTGRPDTSDIPNHSRTPANVETEAADAKHVRAYSPPKKPQREFEQDYTNGTPGKKGDPLRVGKNNKPLSSETIIGRQTVGGGDVGTTFDQIRKLRKRLMGQHVEIVPRSHTDNSPGQVKFHPTTNEIQHFYLADDLKGRRYRRIYRHELGHLLALKTGRKPIPPEIRGEIESMYSTLATGKENLAKLVLPSDPDRGGYTGRKIDDELVAEAFYAAAIDPNYVKTVAPKTYEWLAKLVEDNPDVNKWIHFNSFGAAPLGAALWPGGDDETSTADAFGSPAGSLAGPVSAPGRYVSSGVTDEMKKVHANGLAEVAKTLSQRGLGPQWSKNETFRTLVSALVDLAAKPRSRPHGDPR